VLRGIEARKVKILETQRREAAKDAKEKTRQSNPSPTDDTKNQGKKAVRSKVISIP
jgi:hypothetical protein